MGIFFWVMMGIILTLWSWGIYECKNLNKKLEEWI